MNSKKLSEFFKTIQIIQESNLTNKYKQEIKDFEEKLMGYLSIFFGNNLNFNYDESVGCINANYKGVGLKINIFNGISLTITDNKNSCLLEEFEAIFTKITGRKKTFVYEYYFGDNSYSTIEWSFNPEQRITELNKIKSIFNLTDYYTEEIIKGLGQQLLSMNGYLKLFGNDIAQDVTYKIIQIQKIYPNLRTCILQSWTSSCYNQLVKTKKVS